VTELGYRREDWDKLTSCNNPFRSYSHSCVCRDIEVETGEEEAVEYKEEQEENYMV
jgi:hypothetical protein